MPQLDIFAWSTQMFWVIVALVLIITLLYKFVLPDILLIEEVRTQVVKGNEETFTPSSLTGKSLSKTTLPVTLQDLSHYFADSEQKKAQLAAFHLINAKTKKRNLYAFLKSLPTTSDTKFLNPFLVLISPSDEFILLLSFLIFFSIFYNFFSQQLIKNNLVRIIEEKTRIFGSLFSNKKHLFLLVLIHL